MTIWIVSTFAIGFGILAIGLFINMAEIGSFRFRDDPFYWIAGLGVIGVGAVLMVVEVLL